MEKAIEEEHAEALTWVLQAGMKLGTGRGSRHSGKGVAGKTGTSNDFRDSWFAGFDARKVGIVWIGRDDNKVTGLAGANGALTLWDPIFSDLGVEPITHADMSRVRDVEYSTGLLAAPHCAITVQIPVNEPETLPYKEGCGIEVPATTEEGGWRWPFWDNR